MTAIGKLARRFSLSRSTLLYYDRIGVLKPSGRTPGGYRIYSELDAERLKRICMYRQAGLALDVIQNILAGSQSALRLALEDRLENLDAEMKTVRGQQELACRLLSRELPVTQSGLTKEIWTNLLASAGFTEADMRKWHMAFERNAPEKHQEFLEILNIPSSEISRIRSWKISGRVDQGNIT